MYHYILLWIIIGINIVKSQDQIVQLNLSKVNENFFTTHKQSSTHYNRLLFTVKSGFKVNEVYDSSVKIYVVENDFVLINADVYYRDFVPQLVKLNLNKSEETKNLYYKRVNGAFDTVDSDEFNTLAESTDFVDRSISLDLNRGFSDDLFDSSKVTVYGGSHDQFVLKSGLTLVRFTNGSDVVVNKDEKLVKLVRFQSTDKPTVLQVVVSTSDTDETSKFFELKNKLWELVNEDRVKELYENTPKDPLPEPGEEDQQETDSTHGDVTETEAEEETESPTSPPGHVPDSDQVSGSRVSTPTPGEPLSTPLEPSVPEVKKEEEDEHLEQEPAKPVDQLEGSSEEQEEGVDEDTETEEKGAVGGKDTKEDLEESPQEAVKPKEDVEEQLLDDSDLARGTEVNQETVVSSQQVETQSKEKPLEETSEDSRTDTDDTGKGPTEGTEETQKGKVAEEQQLEDDDDGLDQETKEALDTLDLELLSSGDEEDQDKVVDGEQLVDTANEELIVKETAPSRPPVDPVDGPDTTESLVPPVEPQAPVVHPEPPAHLVPEPQQPTPTQPLPTEPQPVTQPLPTEPQPVTQPRDQPVSVEVPEPPTHLVPEQVPPQHTVPPVSQDQQETPGPEVKDEVEEVEETVQVSSAPQQNQQARSGPEVKDMGEVAKVEETAQASSVPQQNQETRSGPVQEETNKVKEPATEASVGGPKLGKEAEKALDALAEDLDKAYAEFEERHGKEYQRHFVDTANEKPFVKEKVPPRRPVDTVEQQDTKDSPSPQPVTPQQPTPTQQDNTVDKIDKLDEQLKKKLREASESLTMDDLSRSLLTQDTNENIQTDREEGTERLETISRHVPQDRNKSQTFDTLLQDNKNIILNLDVDQQSHVNVDEITATHKHPYKVFKPESGYRFIGVLFKNKKLWESDNKYPYADQIILYIQNNIPIYLVLNTPTSTSFEKILTFDLILNKVTDTLEKDQIKHLLEIRDQEYHPNFDLTGPILHEFYNVKKNSFKEFVLREFSFKYGRVKSISFDGKTITPINIVPFKEFRVFYYNNIPIYLITNPNHRPNHFFRTKSGWPESLPCDLDINLKAAKNLIDDPKYTEIQDLSLNFNEPTKKGFIIESWEKDEITYRSYMAIGNNKITNIKCKDASLLDENLGETASGVKFYIKKGDPYKAEVLINTNKGKKLKFKMFSERGNKLWLDVDEDFFPNV